MENEAPTCPGCGALVPAGDGPAHPYIGASPGCWRLYGSILAREYADPGLLKAVHRLTVDAYAVQHPGSPGRRSTQSVWAHLVGLHLVVERGLSHAFAARVMGLITGQSDRLFWLSPPEHRGSITVADVAAVEDAKAHETLVRQWAKSAWWSWKDQHQLIRAAAENAVSQLETR